MSFNKDALMHKLQEENDDLKSSRKEYIHRLLYEFIDFHTTREIDTLDLKILADRFLDEEYKKEEK